MSTEKLIQYYNWEQCLSAPLFQSSILKSISTAFSFPLTYSHP